MIVRWLLALAALACGGAGLWVLRRRSPLDPLPLSIAATALVATFYPVATAFVAPVSWRNVGDLPEDVLVAAQAQYLAFGLGLLAVAVRAARGAPLGERGRERARPPSARARWRDGVVAWGLFAAGLALYAVYVARVGLGTLADHVDPASKYRASSGLGAWLIGLDLMIVACLWAEASALAPRKKLPFRLASLAIAAWAVGVLSVRTYALALGIGHLHALCRRKGLALARVPLALAAGLAAGYVAVEGYSMVRGVWHDGLLDALRAVYGQGSALETTAGQWVGGSELSHPFITTMEVVRDEEPGALGGASYADALAILVPLALSPDRPESLARSFAAEFYPEVDERGGGTAFSLVAEAWWNLGSFLGPLACGLALGWIFAGVGRRAQRTPDGLAARFSPYLAYVVLLIHRGTVSTLLKQTLPLLAVALVLSAAARLSWGALARREPRALRPRLAPAEPLA